MTLYSAIITLLLVMDPLGNVPLFISVLNSVPPAKRRLVIFRESVIAFVTLTLFLVFGQYILEAMHISQPALAIAGGIILFLIAIKMIFPDASTDDRYRQKFEPFIVPLAIPLIAGPSTMTVVMLLARQEPFAMGRWFLALTIACIITTVILLFAENLRKLLGERVLTAVERLMGMILTTMAVQMFLTGYSQFIYN